MHTSSYANMQLSNSYTLFVVCDLTFKIVSAFILSRLMSWTRSLILWACAYHCSQTVL